MKVVLFCGGMGMRIRDYSEGIPKPLVSVGNRPIIWNIMKYYAHFGFQDFILCLGYKGDSIKDYFVNYKEYETNDFIFSFGGQKIEYKNRDIHNWKITFIDTGLNSTIGERLLKVKDYLEDEDMFLANYSDGLTDMNLTEMIDDFKNNPNYVGSIMAYKPTQSFHILKLHDNERDVAKLCSIYDSGFWQNVGYFIFRKTIFDYMYEGEELVDQPFHRLIKEKKLMAYKYNGFWRSMDTFKDRQLLNDFYNKGYTPWEVWKNRHNVKHYENC